MSWVPDVASYVTVPALVFMLPKLDTVPEHFKKPASVNVIVPFEAVKEPFASKIPGLVEPLAWYLLEWRKTVSNIHEPEKVRHATLMYQKQNDIFRQFISEILEENEASIISIGVIYTEFKDWFKEGFSNMPLPNKNDVKDYFEKIWGDSKSGKWKGWSIKSDGDPNSS